MGTFFVVQYFFHSLGLKISTLIFKLTFPKAYEYKMFDRLINILLQKEWLMFLYSPESYSLFKNIHTYIYQMKIVLDNGLKLHIVMHIHLN